ncbi:MAG TPA: hypothetical protein VG735_14020 [Caulobacterales bacterium]|nr:hypothetical protein [Caulobacterales bacterium]
MTERQTLLDAIATTIVDYRAGQITPPNAAHVDKWVQQFDPAVQLPMLRELDHILKKSYFSKAGVLAFLTGLAQTQKLVGSDPGAFWSGVCLLDIQGGGASQRELNKELEAVLKKAGMSCAKPGSSITTFIYLDDGLFTGNRILRDIESWIQNDAPVSCTLHVVVIALHTRGFDYASGKIRQAAKSASKSVNLTWWRAIELKDRWMKRLSPTFCIPPPCRRMLPCRHTQVR